jgi:hypothetical protein
MRKGIGALVWASALGAPAQAASWIVDAAVDDPAQIDRMHRLFAVGGSAT